MTDAIPQWLSEIEQEQNIEILLAIESGSRAWGFPSKDSDYDIRVIYRHPTSWYLTPFNKRNVIENIFLGDWDVAGWDISKCLQLIYKGNAVIYEWLHSPIVYQKNAAAVQTLSDFSAQAFNPKTVFYHYLSLAKRKLLDETTKTQPKAFLYALRALLCARWVAEDQAIAPVEFAKLTERFLNEPLQKSTEQLLLDKQDLGEQDELNISQDLLEFAHEQLVELSALKVPARTMKAVERYDEVFHKLLAWNYNS